MSKEVSDLIENKKFVDYVINKTLSIENLCDRVGVEFSDMHNFFCPFHENNDTPAAKYYSNKDKGDTPSIYCFSERRIYKAVDFFKKELINTRVESIFYRIWKQLSQEQQQYLLDTFELQGGDLGTTSLNKYKDELELFKSHRIDFTTFCDYLLKSIQK